MATKPKNKPQKAKKPSAKSYSATSLGLNKNALPHSIIDVVGVLQRAGFEAYIVGGGVRDELLGLAPKDFDAVTNARPHEIKAVFGGRCRIIGRRFQLAHVYAGREMIEVATFRAPPKDDTHTTDDGMITRDNVWGTIEEDFARRDFSINALYYQPIRGEILDFCGAIDDIGTKTLRLLGDAKVRIEEDPVRLLRALRFKAKLGFEFDKNLAKQFNPKNWALLEQVSAHRLYDESQKMFSGGYLTALLPLLYRHGAMTTLTAYPTSAPTALMMQVAQSTDERIQNGRGANPAYFFAVLLWQDYLHQLKKLQKKLPFNEAQQKAARTVIERQNRRTAIPRFAEEFISHIWWLQPKLTNPKPSDVSQLMRQARFRAAYDFLVARELADDSDSEPTLGMGKWWTNYQLATPDQAQAMCDALASRRKRRTQQAEHDTQELAQLHKLALSHTPSLTEAEPLFGKGRGITKKRKAVPTPLFDPTNYSEADFLRILADEPFIPARRRRRLMPNVSPASDAQTQTPQVKAGTATAPRTLKRAKPSLATKAPKTTKDEKATKAKTPTKKPKARKKSNAKPKADE